MWKMNNSHKITLWLPKLGPLIHHNASAEEINKMAKLDDDYFVTVCNCDHDDGRNNSIIVEDYFNPNILKRCSSDGCRY